MRQKERVERNWKRDLSLALRKNCDKASAIEKTRKKGDGERKAEVRSAKDA